MNFRPPHTSKKSYRYKGDFLRKKCDFAMCSEHLTLTTLVRSTSQEHPTTENNTLISNEIIKKILERSSTFGRKRLNLIGVNTIIG